jgi:hypothetical protein
MRCSCLYAFALAACSHPPGPAGSASDASPGADGHAAIDAAIVDVTGDGGTYRSSLSVCWNDATCPRVFALAHGGAWDAATTPYDSNAALMAAYADGDDGVKIDVRITKDHIPVIAHSSPILTYESLDCANQRIEDMTAAEVTACHRFPSTTEKFQRLDDVLGYLRGKMVVQLCVKLVGDFGGTIDAVHALGAEDFAFLEINAGDVDAVVPALTGSSSVYYLVNLASDLTVVDGLLARNNPRLFMYEIDPGVDIGTLVPDRLHPAGVRAFIYDNAAAPSVSQLSGHYAAGFDAVSSQSGPNGVQARVMTNTSHNVTPP